MSVTMLSEVLDKIKAGDYVEVAYRYEDGTIVNTRKVVQGKGQEPLLFVEALGTIYTLRDGNGVIPKQVLRVTLLPFSPPKAYKAGPVPRDPRTLMSNTANRPIYAVESEEDKR